MSHKRPRDRSGKSDDTMIGAKSKVGRTAVYAGHSRKLSHVPRLEDMCINVLMDHVERIHEFGDVPYFIMKPILGKCSLENLQRIEKLNPKLVMDEDSDELWEKFCTSQFRNEKRKKRETFREMYRRLSRQRDERLEALAKKYHKQKHKSDIEKKKVEKIDAVGQVINGKMGKRMLDVQPSALSIKESALKSRMKSSTISCSGSKAQKPRVAPLMAKVKSLMRSKHR